MFITWPGKRELSLGLLSTSGGMGMRPASLLPTFAQEMRSWPHGAGNQAPGLRDVHFGGGRGCRAITGGRHVAPLLTVLGNLTCPPGVPPLPSPEHVECKQPCRFPSPYKLVWSRSHGAWDMTFQGTCTSDCWSQPCLYLEPIGSPTSSSLFMGKSGHCRGAPPRKWK